MNTDTTIEHVDAWATLKGLALNAVSSPLTKAAYGAALEEFFAWYLLQPRSGFNKATVNEWRSSMEARGLGSSSINVRLSAVRRLAVEAADNQLIGTEIADAVKRVRGVKELGVRLGNWLTLQQAQALLASPKPETIKGKRDRAILAFLLGCGLRRGELASLRIDQLQQREGRWCIIDLKGKHGRVRTVPVPAWVKHALDAWIDGGGLEDGRVFQALNKAGNIVGECLSERAIWDIVRAYATSIGIAGLAPHDLRRTCAKLCRGAGGELEQIQLLLGHASIQTTERYLGTKQNISRAPNDAIAISL